MKGNRGSSEEEAMAAVHSYFEQELKEASARLREPHRAARRTRSVPRGVASLAMLAIVAIVAVTAMRVVVLHPGASATPPECESTRLSLGGVRQGEGGLVNIGITIMNTTAAPCVLVGLPSAVVLVGADGDSLEIQLESPMPTAGRPLLLHPGTAGEALLTVYWMNWCGAAPGPLDVRLTFRDGPGSASGPLGGTLLPRCDTPGKPSTIAIGEISTAP